MKKSSLSVLLSAFSFSAALFVLTTFAGCINAGDKLPSEVNDGRYVESSEEKNAAFKAQDAEKSEAVDENMMEAPEEGLSRIAYEDLEQPAPLKGVNETLLFKTQFIISYNVETHCPNYVCWSLTKDRLKINVQRSDNFHGDPVISENSQVQTFDYSGSGYDRGHMCPAGDNKNDAKAMDESFCMTNICPQAHNLNTGDWNDLEQQCRQWVRDYGTLYICCGPIYDSKNPKTIGKRRDLRIAVPDRFFKVILSMGRVPKAIGFIYPNDDTHRDMRSYAVSVDKVEEITGYDFFYQLPDDQEKKLESVCKPAEWGI
ncbi:MAG: DNA/RNA non-specific endonuclease [Prevotellaceae bacterium]|nr:DNA/RNA non-specific endonuclease [Candidatus Minthosoma caballi]